MLCSCFHRQLGWVALCFGTGLVVVYSRRKEVWKCVARMKCDFLDGPAHFCVFSRDGSALILGFTGKLRLWNTRCLIQIPDDILLFKEIKYLQTMDQQEPSLLDHELGCVELYRAFKNIGYCHQEMCRIMDTMIFEPSHRRTRADLNLAQLSASHVQLPITAALYISCKNLQPDSDDCLFHLAKQNPIAFVFDTDGRELGRTECSYNTANPVFLCPILLRYDESKIEQHLTMKIYNLNPLVTYKVRFAVKPKGFLLY